MIRHAIEKLPEKQRAAVLLHKYQELDYAEIAKILSCSESALKSLLFRAYEVLRVELAPLVARDGSEVKRYGSSREFESGRVRDVERFVGKSLVLGQKEGRNEL